jgi:beta-glucanase (GH16 family)
VYHNPHSKHGPVLPSNVVVHHGMVSLRVARHNGVWSGAGMCACRATTGTYGTYLIRARYDHGLGTHAYALLWPVKGWPPEVDFMEFDARDPMHHQLVLTNHYSSANRMQHAFIPGDYSRWHTIGLQWTPTSLRYTLDGRTSAVMKGHVPHVPMWLGIANNIGTGAHPGARTPNPVSLDIDWIAYYKKV